jgi:putative ABC transport system permease protein
MVAEITWLNLSWSLIPVAVVAFIYSRWQGSLKEVAIACTRMIIQLIGVGYALIILFANPSPWLSTLIIAVMLSIASWIAVRPVRQLKGYFLPALAGLGIAVIAHLILALGLIIEVDTWYEPRFIIPLAGMFFANTMNCISLAAERYASELNQQNPKAKITAFHAAMIPQINGLLAVGLVALPGMMTGQILSGVSPLIAVKYQILIMTMIFGSSGLGSALLLTFLDRQANGSDYSPNS